jgi:hypothetical protein
MAIGIQLILAGLSFSTTLRLGEPLTNFDYLLSLLTKVINNATQEGTRGRQAKMAPDAATYAGFKELCKD